MITGLLIATGMYIVTYLTLNGIEHYLSVKSKKKATRKLRKLAKDNT